MMKVTKILDQFRPYFQKGHRIYDIMQESDVLKLPQNYQLFEILTGKSNFFLH